MMKVWRINYKKGGEITKLCDINEISPRLYTVAHKVKCNSCMKDATHLVEGTTAFGTPYAIPLCAEHHKEFTQ